MWKFASNAVAGAIGLKNNRLNPSRATSERSADENYSDTGRGEGLKCPICWESFNVVENVPYILWCGHTLCKNCVLRIQSAVLKFPILPTHLRFFISCPWCNLLSVRLIYKGNLKFPRKNFFLLWMVESQNGNRVKSNPLLGDEHQPFWSSRRNLAMGNQLGYTTQRHPPYIQFPEQLEPNQDSVFLICSHLNVQRLRTCLRKSLNFIVHLMAKIPLIIIFFLIILYAIPASAAILISYIFITFLFALPSFLVLYFAYPTLDWLIGEIFT
ncbi:uncharacterized protein LOC131146237 [Malania oleifera]|uniref:uncharacterized protein LOC131146237 n=1 Tax=Malania oleifera TaxID=397392 RepID=UPI0025ADA78F|nr:uncharacterized protein LOC131146237 [Malania oleifera]XP_057951661.1 uncharacterized protein LOC131146237 [Malania oleifera]XP_057951662.1 uncharacterized protein LOC131146237 [Malania oleifera]XP_057951663.1 uncharacterized protein LOC131146237 [Malania oleifera]XP_057951664.1 uncharacterized protein LOC131146237 [Malania oleifera]XP_057951665.1 uncharacterized protein LOC131146237 [Malania oleifera]XP_057951667.1 uncharacterized protein LOC131146237 [Malania oleifera]XP_057951668.1 unc